jgi:hypothetical protein
MRELLVRYLLGELDPQEQSQLEKRLRESPELRRELAYLQTCFSEANEPDLDPAEPPSGLAERTTVRVADLAESGEPDGVGVFDIATGRVAAFAGANEPPVGVLGWSLADISVAGGVFLAMSMLLLPALRNSQDASRRVSCANNLRASYFVVAPYADRNGGELPPVNPNEFAGMFFVRLVGDDYVSLEDARRWLACSGSPLGEAIRSGEAQIFIPSPSQLQGATPNSLARLFRTSTGSYAVPLPSIQNNRFTSPRLFDSDDTPILADAPKFELTVIENANHFGGLNVLYSGGCVKFQTSAIAPLWNDHLFLNSQGQPAAGLGPHDTVLAPGDRPAAVKLIGTPD